MMKAKRLVALLCVLVLAFSLSVTALADAVFEPFWDLSYDVDYYVYIVSGNGKGLTTHSGPGSNYDDYDQVIPDGTRVHISKECVSDYGNKWGYVDSTVDQQDYWGWIYLTDTSPTPVETWEVDYIAYILTDDGTGLNVRMGPDVHYDKIDSLVPDGTRLHVLKEGRLGDGKTWGYVEYGDGKHGWLSLTFVTTTPPVIPSPIPKPVTYPSSAPAGVSVEPPASSAPVTPSQPPASDARETQPPRVEPNRSSSGSSYSVMIMAILGISVLCLALAAVLLIVSIKKRK